MNPATSANYLVVPILVDALRLTVRQSVLAPPAFSELPYTGPDAHGEPADQNVDRPFLAETTHPPAFNPPEFPLDPGVHLHWILPRVLRTGDTATGALTFPPAPDQWLVIRRRNQVIERVWRVDGAIVWPEPDPAAPPPEGPGAGRSIWPWKLNRDASGTPCFHVQPGTRPWRHVGHIWNCTASSWETTSTNTPRGATRLEQETGQPLTASGWGDPAFAGFYPGCVGQFGLFDDGLSAAPAPTPVDLDSGVEYIVVGWHNDPGRDPLTRIQHDLNTFRDKNAKTPDLDAATHDYLGRRLGWDINWDIKNGPLPAATLYLGKVSSANFLRPAGDRTPPGWDVAIGANGTQATATLLASRMREQWPPQIPLPSRRALERQLEAVTLEKQLSQHTVDVGITLDDLAVRRSFAARRGGLQWVIRGKAPAGAPPTSRPDDDIELPAELADLLADLNQAQEQLEQAERRLAAQQEQLYTDWYRAIASGYPNRRLALDWVVDLEVSDHPAITDEIWRLIRQVRLPAIAETAANRQQAQDQSKSLATQLIASLETHNRTPQAPQWELTPAPADPFYAPTEVAIILSPRDGLQSHRQRWQGTGLEHNDQGWLLTGTAGRKPENEADLRALLSLPLVLDPQVHPGETPPLRMDWRAQFAPRVVTDVQGSYTPDWITNLPPEYEEATQLSGTSHLTGPPLPALRAALLACIQARLAENILLLRNNQPVYASAELDQPIQATEQRVSWLTFLGVDDTDPGHNLESKLTEQNCDLLIRWFHDWTQVTSALTAGQDQQAWQAPSAAGTPFPGMAQFPAKGPIAAALTDWLNGSPSSLPPWVNAYRSRWQTSPTLSAYLLRELEASGYLCSRKPCPSVRGRGFIHGIPDGGPLAAAIVSKANQLSGDNLAQCLSFSDAAAASLLEQRPFAQLADLARLPAVDNAVISALLRKVEEDCAAAPPRLAAPPLDQRADVPLAIDPVVTVLTSWKSLQCHSGAMVLTLNGFNDALLQLDASPQLPVADPLGFPDHQEITDLVIRPAVANARRCAPRPDFRFAPLRAGALQITGLRLVDTFGFPRDLPLPAMQKNLVVPHGWLQKLHPGFQVELPPQLALGARLRLRWLDGEDPSRPWTPHPGRSPLCGWLVANTFNGLLDFHDPGGPLLGSLREDGSWLVAPGRKGPATAAAIAPTGLRLLASSLAAAIAGAEDPIIDSHSGFRNLVNGIELALEEIHPDTNIDQKALSLLLSRPVAVVRASLAFELERPPCARQDGLAVNAELQELDRRLRAGDSLDGFTASLAADPHYRRCFDRIEVPVTLGAQQRLADGVVAWSQISPSGQLGPLQFPHLCPSPLQLSLDPAAPPQRLLLLVDPAAQIHLAAGTGGTYSTAFLPPLAVSLPTTAINRAHLARELCSYSGPHLTPRSSLHAPVLRESGWDTSMLLLEPGKWVPLSTLPLIDRAALEALLDAPGGIWNNLVRDGILVPIPGEPSLAHQVPLPPPPAQNPPAPASRLEDHLQGYPNPAQLVAALRQCGRSLLPPLATLNPASLELREGFLALRRSQS